MHQWRYNQYYTVERAAYTPENIQVPFEIEAVSLALQDYLTNEFGAQSEHISIAKHDIPSRIDPEQLTTWRAQVRKELSIPKSAYVYCYNGSVKPWQNAKDIVALFLTERKAHPNAYFLVYTQNTTAFHNAFKKAHIDST